MANLVDWVKKCLTNKVFVWLLFSCWVEKLSSMIQFKTKTKKTIDLTCNDFRAEKENIIGEKMKTITKSLSIYIDLSLLQRWCSIAIDCWEKEIVDRIMVISIYDVNLSRKQLVYSNEISEENDSCEIESMRAAVKQSIHRLNEKKKVQQTNFFMFAWWSIYLSVASIIQFSFHILLTTHLIIIFAAISF